MFSDEEVVHDGFAIQLQNLLELVDVVVLKTKKKFKSKLLKLNIQKQNICLPISTQFCSKIKSFVKWIFFLNWKFVWLVRLFSYKPFIKIWLSWSVILYKLNLQQLIIMHFAWTEIIATKIAPGKLTPNLSWPKFLGRSCTVWPLENRTGWFLSRK